MEMIEARDAYAATLPDGIAAEFIKNSELKRNAVDVGDAYLSSGRPLADYTAAAGACDAYCVGAKGRHCHCECLGSNHGLAHGLEPWQVLSSLASIDERIASGLLPLDAKELRAAEAAEKRAKQNPQWKRTNDSKDERGGTGL